MRTSKQIKIGAILSYITIFVNIITGLVYTPWMIRSIGNSDYGLYTLVMSLINTFTVDFGLSFAVQKYVSKYLADQNQKKIEQTIGIVFKLYLLLTMLIAVVFVVLFFLVELIYPELTAAEITKFKGLYLIAVINCVVTFPFVPTDGILHSYERFIESKVCGFIYKIIAVTLTAVALVAGMGVYSLVTANLIAAILYVLLRLLAIQKLRIRLDLKYWSTSYLKEMLMFSVWTSVSSLAIRLILSLQPSILGMVAGTAEIAVFGYAVSLENYIYLFVNALNGFFLPTLTRMGKREAEEERQVVELMTTVGRFILLLYTVIFIGFSALGREFITLLLGSEYVGSYYCTILICAYGIVAYPQQIANTYILVKDKVKKQAIISIFTLLLCVVISVLIGRFYGAFGASVGIFVSLVIYTFLMNRMYQKDLNIDIKFFFKNCHLKMMPGFILCLVLAFMIAHIPSIGWFGFSVKVFLILILYCLITWFMLLNSDEKNMIQTVFKKIYKKMK